MMKADNLISDSVNFSGMVRPEAAARGSTDANEGLVDRYVLSGLAYRATVSRRAQSLHHSIVTHLNTSFQRQKCITGIAHLKYSSKPIFCQVPNLQYL